MHSRGFGPFVDNFLVVPTTSIIIVNYNFGGYLADCLASIAEASRASPDKPEVVVVDNGSTDGSVEKAAARFPDATWVRNGENLGFARACNIGIGRSRGEFILFLNPDTVIRPGALDAAGEFMAGHPRCGALGGLVFNSDGSRQPTVRRFPTYTNILFGRNSPVTKLLPGNRRSREYLCADLDYAQPRLVDALCGAFLFVRRRALAEVGVFDERFFFMVEDTDLCYRLRQAGWEVWYFPFPVCIHHLGERIKKNRNREKFHHGRGMLRFYYKHYRPGLLVRAALNIGFLLRIAMITAFDT